MYSPDTCRRWTQEISRLKTRAAKSVRRAVPSADALEILDETLTTCDGLLRELAGAQLESEALARRCDAQVARWEYLFQHLPIPCVEADAQGTILKANRAASLLLNISGKHLENRLLMHFTEDRAAFGGLLRTMAHERSPQRASLILRPRERAVFDVEATILPSAPDGSAWLWFLVPSRGRHMLATKDMRVAS